MTTFAGTLSQHGLTLERAGPRVLQLDRGRSCNTIRVGWRGDVYDCDFNQMMDMPMGGAARRYLWDLEPNDLEGQPIAVASLCFGCTAGAGSSCSGALI